MIISFRDFDKAFEKLEIPKNNPVIAHVSLDAFDQITGGEDAILGALIDNFDRILMPAFTYQTLVTPKTGPKNNGIDYGARSEDSLLAEIFYEDTPVSPEIGKVEEKFRTHPDTTRSHHPVLSFSGINIPTTLSQQTINKPYAPLAYLQKKKTWVLLIGATHQKNVSLHLAEQKAGRHQFTRWALTRTGIKQFSPFPGCSKGFEEIRPYLNKIAHRERIGENWVHAFPMNEMINIVVKHLQENPLAMLCGRANCLRCQEIRKIISTTHPRYHLD